MTLALDNINFEKLKILLENKKGNPVLQSSLWGSYNSPPS